MPMLNHQFVKTPSPWGGHTNLLRQHLYEPAPPFTPPGGGKRTMGWWSRLHGSVISEHATKTPCFPYRFRTGAIEFL